MAKLDDILSNKQAEISLLRHPAALRRLRERAEQSSAPLDFAASLGSEQGKLRIVAEVKRGSPSKGILSQDLDASDTAQLYEKGGAAAISVLTDHYFAGSLKDLRDARRTVGVPLLRKDFVLDEAQVYEARAAGADALLLIVDVVDSAQLSELQSLATELGMAALVEVASDAALDQALNVDAKIIGINNRDLWSVDYEHDPVDLQTAERLIDHIPSAVRAVSMSGIKKLDDARRLAAAGFDAVLVGEYLTHAEDPVQAVLELAELDRSRRRQNA